MGTFAHMGVCVYTNAHFCVMTVQENAGYGAYGWDVKTAQQGMLFEMSVVSLKDSVHGSGS